MTMINEQSRVLPRNAPDADWWKTAVTYQVYVRSFKDSTGDGIGDIRGLTEGLPYIASLGCDAIWLNPCYVSPQGDHGYDIADYRNIDPDYGTLDDFAHMLEQAHELGLNVLMDMVANHCSVDHRWFQAACASPPGSPARDLFIIQPGKGPDGVLPPNNWESVFGGSAWSPLPGDHAGPTHWYFHSFDASQPDFNWNNPQVVTEFEDILRFWFDMGVDGFRIDVAHGLYKSGATEDFHGTYNHHMWHQPPVLDLYESWRAIADSYTPPKFFVGEVWLPTASEVAAYTDHHRLHQVFDFGLLVQPWDAASFHEAICQGLVTNADQHPAWVLANHDVHRAATRYGQEQILDKPDPTDMIAAARRLGPANLELGTKRSLAAQALLLALPGAVFLYQGEELGLPEVLDIPDSARQDPIWKNSGGKEIGRDGCRIPIPWVADSAHYGFSTTQGTLWLPQPSSFSSYAITNELECATSPLRIIQRFVQARRQLVRPDTSCIWVSLDNPNSLSFVHGNLLHVTNFGEDDLFIPDDWPIRPELTTYGSPGLSVPRDTSTWYRIVDSNYPAFSRISQ